MIKFEGLNLKGGKQWSGIFLLAQLFGCAFLFLK